MYNKIPYDAMKLNKADVKTPVHFSLLKETNPEVVLSTLKKAEKGDQLVLRIYNPTDTSKIASFEMNGSLKQAYTANLNEKPLELLEGVDNKVQTRIKPNQVKTILFK